MSEFQLNRTKRVYLPPSVSGDERVQGVITACKDITGREPEYTVQWLAADAADARGILDMRTATVAESDLLAAQLPGGDKSVGVTAQPNVPSWTFSVGFDPIKSALVGSKRPVKAKRKASHSRKRR